MADWIQKPYLGVEINHNHPLFDGLEGCWVLNQGGGSKACDLSGYGNDGDLVATASFQSGGVWFDGNSDYITLGDSTILDGATSCSFVVCVSPNSLATGDAMIRKWTAGKQAFIFGIDSGNLDEFLMGINNDAQDQACVIDTSAANLVNNVEYQLSGVWSGSNNIALYKNGTPMTTGTDVSTPAAIAATNEHLLLGAKYAGGSPSNFWDGLIKYVYIWKNRALTASEIAWLYREPYAMVEPMMPIWMIAPVGVPPSGRIMSSLVSAGGLAGAGGIAGPGGGLAG